MLSEETMRWESFSKSAVDSRPGLGGVKGVRFEKNLVGALGDDGKGVMLGGLDGVEVGERGESVNEQLTSTVEALIDKNSRLAEVRSGIGVVGYVAWIALRLYMLTPYPPFRNSRATGVRRSKSSASWRTTF